MTSPLQAAARALVLAQCGCDSFDDLEPEAQEIAIETVRAVLAAYGITVREVDTRLHGWGHDIPPEFSPAPRSTP